MRKIMSLTLVSMIILTSVIASTPVSAKTQKDTTISLSWRHSATIKNDGTLWSWGSNWYGELGNGTTTDSIVPIKIMDNVYAISLGGSNGAAIKNDGTLWIWGCNTRGRLGNGTTIDSMTPIKIMDDVVAISLGDTHGAAIKNDGTLWTWGQNEYGQLGNGTNTDSATPIKIMNDVMGISLERYSSAAIKTDGSLWTWGWNIHGMLGNGTTTDSVVPIKIMDNVSEVDLGENHSAAIKNDGTLWTWGRGDYGSLGNGTRTDSVTPIKIMDNVKTVCLGGLSSAAIKNDGTLWTWGENWHGQLGYETTTSYSVVPIKIMDNVSVVSLGNSHSAAIKNDRTLWMWGENSTGKLGNGTKIDSLIPIKIMDDVMIPNVNQSTIPPQMPSKWAKFDINQAISLELIPKELQSDYRMPITRLDFCKLALTLYRKITRKTGIIGISNKFNDLSGLSTDDSFTIDVVSGLGIVNGYEDGTFRPYNEISREEAAVMLARTSRVLEKTTTSKMPIIFSDFAEISEWAKEDVDFISALEVMTGVSSGTYTLAFQPKENYTREQAMITFLRLYNAITMPETLSDKFPDKENLYTIKDVPEKQIEKYPTNFYNFNGMYIDSFKSTTQSDNSCNVSFDVYNTAYTYGIVEVFDKNDNLINAVPIQKMTDNATSIKGSIWDNSIELINDIKNGSLLTYRQESGFAEKTEVKVDIPYGGYIKITNAMQESLLLGILNAGDIAMSVKGLCGDFKSGFDKDMSKKLAEKITVKAFGSEVFMNMLNSQDDFIEKMYENIGQDVVLSSESIGDFTKTLTNNLEDLKLSDLVIDSAKSIGISSTEKAFTSLAGPAGVALTGMFAGTKAANLCIEAKHFHELLFDNKCIMIQNLGGEY